MSLAIDVDKVSHVLLHDGWHTVAPNPDGVSSFCMDAYEYIWGELGDRSCVVHQDPQHCATLGFEFVDEKSRGWIGGPVTSILAVRYGR